MARQEVGGHWAGMARGLAWGDTQQGQGAALGAGSRLLQVAVASETCLPLPWRPWRPLCQDSFLGARWLESSRSSSSSWREAGHRRGRPRRTWWAGLGPPPPAQVGGPLASFPSEEVCLSLLGSWGCSPPSPSPWTAAPLAPRVGLSPVDAAPLCGIGRSPSVCAFASSPRGCEQPPPLEAQTWGSCCALSPSPSGRHQRTAFPRVLVGREAVGSSPWRRPGPVSGGSQQRAPPGPWPPAGGCPCGKAGAALSASQPRSPGVSPGACPERLPGGLLQASLLPRGPGPGPGDAPQTSEEHLPPLQGTRLRRQKALGGRSFSPRSTHASGVLGWASRVARALCASSVGARSRGMGRGVHGGFPPPAPPVEETRMGRCGGSGVRSASPPRPVSPRASFPGNQLLAPSPGQGR